MPTISFSTDQKRVVLALGYSKDTMKSISTATGLTLSIVKTSLEQLIEIGLVFKSDLFFLLTDIGELMFDRLVSLGMKVKVTKKKKRRKRSVRKKARTKSTGFLKRKVSKGSVPVRRTRTPKSKLSSGIVKVNYSDSASARREVILNVSKRSPSRAVKILTEAKKVAKVENKFISAKNLGQVNSDIKYFKELSTSNTKLLTGGNSN